MRALITPDGVVGAYGNCENDVVATDSKTLTFRSGSVCERNADGCVPRHLTRAYNLHMARQIFADPATAQCYTETCHASSQLAHIGVAYKAEERVVDVNKMENPRHRTATGAYTWNQRLLSVSLRTVMLTPSWRMSA